MLLNCPGRLLAEGRFGELTCQQIGPQKLTCFGLKKRVLFIFLNKKAKKIAVAS